MKNNTIKRHIFLAALLGVIGLGSAQADSLIVRYVAKLSRQDHYNIRGQRLKDAAAIIRQNRVKQIPTPKR